MPSIHRVIQYSGLNYHEVLQLPCDMFLLMAKNSIIDDMMKTKEGQEFLDKCKRLKQTDIDIGAFRKKVQPNRKEGK